MWHFSLSAFGVCLYVRFPASSLFWVCCGFFKFILFTFAECIECVNYVFNKFGEFLAIIQSFFWTTLSFLFFGKSNDINDTNDGPWSFDLRPESRWIFSIFSPLIVKVHNFYQPLQITDSFLCHLYSTIESIKWILNFRCCIFSILKFLFLACFFSLSMLTASSSPFQDYLPWPRGVWL